MADEFTEALASFLEALDDWGVVGYTERAKEILDFQRTGYDLAEYLEQQPERSLAELN